MRTAVVSAAAVVLRDRYIDPVVGDRAATALESSVANGDYDLIVTPAEFARRLTDQLFEITHDKHVGVGSPDWFPPRRPAVSAMPWETARHENGIVRADRLANGIGYIELIGFGDLAEVRPSLDRAMKPLRRTRALIVDARRNTGGSAQTEAYFASFFLKRERSVVVDRIVRRTPGKDAYTVEEYRSSPTPVKYVGRPLIVLTSGYTFSAGEALAYNLRALGLARIIGEQTGGGANPVGPFPLVDGFVLNVSTGRDENAVTGTNWEGTGVTPDVAVPATEALQRALEALGLETKKTQIAELSQQPLFMPRDQERSLQ